MQPVGCRDGSARSPGRGGLHGVEMVRATASKGIGTERRRVDWAQGRSDTYPTRNVRRGERDWCPMVMASRLT